MLSSLTWKTLARKNIKKQKKLVFRLKALFLLKKIFFFFFSPIANSDPDKKSFLKFSFFLKVLQDLKFRTKIVSIRHFEREFQKPNVKFKISILEFVNMQGFIQKQKIFKLGTKNTLLRCFWDAIQQKRLSIF